MPDINELATATDDVKVAVNYVRRRADTATATDGMVASVYLPVSVSAVRQHGQVLVHVGLGATTGYRLPPTQLVLTVSLVDPLLHVRSSRVLAPSKTVTDTNTWELSFSDADSDLNGFVTVVASGGPYIGQAKIGRAHV